MPLDILAEFNRIFPRFDVTGARNGGAGARRLGIAYESNPYPDGTSMAVRNADPELAEKCAAKRAAWFEGWLDADAKIAGGWE